MKKITLFSSFFLLSLFAVLTGCNNSSSTTNADSSATVVPDTTTANSSAGGDTMRTMQRMADTTDPLDTGGRATQTAPPKR